MISFKNHYKQKKTQYFNIENENYDIQMKYLTISILVIKYQFCTVKTILILFSICLYFYFDFIYKKLIIELDILSKG